jgi:uncharacterized protein YkwD
MIPAATLRSPWLRVLATAAVLVALSLLGLRSLPVSAADPPVIQDVQPREAYFGALVTLSGARFGASPGEVTFAGAGGGRYRATTRNWSDARIQAEVPYNTVPGDVIVRTADGRVSNGFRFSPPCWDRPVIKQIIPAAAMQCEVVKIIGCGFGDFQYEQTLTFNGVDATGTIIGNWSDTELLVPVPDEATSGPVVVTNKRRVPSDGFRFRVRDDAPEWDVLPTIGTSTHGFDVTVRVGVEPEEGPPGETTVRREHWQKVGDAVRREVELTVTWRSATTFVQQAIDPAGEVYTIEGIVDPDAGSLRVDHHDAWDTQVWDNGSSREREVCHSDLRFSAELPIGKDALDRPDFNVWAPRWGFGAGGADLGRRVRGVEYKQSCYVYDYAGHRLRRDGTYEYLGVDWAASTVSHVFEGTGKDPCAEDEPKWEPLGQIHGRVSAPVPGRDTSWMPEFTGFPIATWTAALPGVPVRLYLTPPIGPRREVAYTVADEDGRYRFYHVPLTNTLDLEVMLEDHAVEPPAFRVTYRRADGAARAPVILRTRPFSNVDAPLLEKDVAFVAGAGASAVDPDHLDDVALTYAHTAQAWWTAGDLGLTLDLHAHKGEPLEIRTFSPVKDTFWHGDHSTGPAYGNLPIPDNVHVNIAAAEAQASHGDRPMNREWHELGHHVQADIQGDRFPYYWVSNVLSDTNHYGRYNPSTADSWTEGFAEFFSALVARRAARDLQPGLYRMNNGSVVNLDENLTSFTVRGGDARADEELAVASLLWDLVDSAGDGADARPMAVTESLLVAWGVRLDKLARPVAPADVRWPPKLYRDRIALDDRVLMFLIAEADKIAATRGVKSPNSAPDYRWIFDVHQLYRTLQTMGVGQDVGASGLTALDELFVAHGFFADTGPQNLYYDPGELIGMTSNYSYTVTTTWGARTVWQRADRYSPAPVPEAYLRFDARDAATGTPVAVTGFEVAVTFAPPYALYDYTYRTAPTSPGRLALIAPDPVYASTVRVTPLGDHQTTDSPFEVTGDAYWRAIAGGSGEDVFRHTFTVRREPWTLAIPIVVRNARPTRAPRGATVPPPTAPSSAAFAADLVTLINAERERAGRTALTVQTDLAAAAGWYARDMASSGDYRADHSDRQGRTMPERLKALGYTSDGRPRWHVAENIARGQATPAEVLAAWLDSAPHRANILDRDACEIGVAHALAPAPGDAYRHYWVADFGCRSARPTMPAIDEPGGTPAPPGSTPSPTATRTGVGPSPTATPGTPPSSTPVVPTPRATLVLGWGIQGVITQGGAPVGGVLLHLMRVTGTEHQEITSARTAGSGAYTFGNGMATLTGSQYYYVLYRNDEQDAQRVTTWYGPHIAPYRMGDAVAGGDFDIADVALLDPPGAMSAWLPTEFRWARRTFGPHTYRWLLYDDATRQQWATGDLGDRGDYTLSALPDGVTFGREYWWYVRVYAGAESYGVARFARSIAFLPSAGPGETPTPTATATAQATWVDDFCDARSGWPSGDTGTERYGYAAGRECYYALAFRLAARALAIPSGRSVGAGRDYSLAASGYPRGSGSFGVLFGMTASGDRYYVFIIGTSGTYALYRSDAGAWSSLVSPTAASGIDPDFGNVVRVDCAGDEIRLYLDDVLLTTARDGFPHHGRYGVYAESDAAGFEARYTRYLEEGR